MHQDLAGTTAAALRSAMLLRHDSVASRETAVTAVSSSSHVFRTVSSGSTVRTSTDLTDAPPAAAAPQPAERRPSSTVEQLHAKAGAMARRLTSGGGGGGRLSSAGVDTSQRAAQSAQAAQATLKRLEEDRKRKAGGTEMDGKASGMPRDVSDERIKHTHRFADARARGQARARAEARGHVEAKERSDGKGKGEATAAAEAGGATTPPPPPSSEVAPPADKTLQEKQAALQASVAERAEGPVKPSREGKKGVTVATAQAEADARARAVAEAKTTAIAQRRRQQAELDTTAAEAHKMALAEVNAAEQRRRALVSGEAERERARLLKAKAEIEAARRSRDRREKERLEKEREVRRAKATAAGVVAASSAPAEKTEKDREARADKKGKTEAGTGQVMMAAAALEKKRANGFMKKELKERVAPSSGYSLWAVATPRQEPSTTVGEPRESVSSSRGVVCGVPKVDSRTTAVQRSLASTGSNGVVGGSKQPISSSDAKPTSDAKQSFSSSRSIIPGVTKVDSRATPAPFATTDSNDVAGDSKRPLFSSNAKSTPDAKPTVSPIPPPKPLKGSTCNPVVAVPAADVVGEKVSSTDENVSAVTIAVTIPMDKDQAPELDIPYASVVGDVAVTLDAAPTPLSQRERDENVLRAHLASWRFCFHEAAALLTPVLGAGNVETPHGGVSETAAREVDSGTAGGANAGLAAAGGFLVAPSEEIDLQSEVSEAGEQGSRVNSLGVFFVRSRAREQC